MMLRLMQISPLFDEAEDHYLIGERKFGVSCS
jgi:hypothetical protein